MKTSKIRKSVFRQLPFAIAMIAFGQMSVSCMSPITSGLSAENGILEFENEIFSSRIKVIGDKTVRLDGDFLKAQVTIKNIGKRDLDCQYSFTWKDNDGLLLTSVDPLWHPLNLHGREQKILEAVCPVPGAVDFRLVLRPE